MVWDITIDNDDDNNNGNDNGKKLNYCWRTHYHMKKLHMNKINVHWRRTNTDYNQKTKK